MSAVVDRARLIAAVMAPFASRHVILGSAIGDRLLAPPTIQQFMV
jgi:hypothetical protein